MSSNLVSRARRAVVLAAAAAVAAGCTVASPVPSPTAVPPQATPTTALSARIALTMLYPTASSVLEMGQMVRFIEQALDAQGNPAVDAQMTVTVRDPTGKAVAELSAKADDQGVLRTDKWTVPHRSQEGVWAADVGARAGSAEGSAQGLFQVKNSTSESLMNKYGFWLDAPAINGIIPDLFGEKGDARNGMIRWGGTRPAQHVLVERWIDVNWREGNAGLKDAEEVRRFMLEQVGVLGMTPIRSIGPITPMRFKQWDAWRVAGRGQFQTDHVEWVAFYAPEADKTILLGTKVVVPASGIDEHALLRDDFAFVPEVHANGTATEPLPRLLPGPELVGPPLGAKFEGHDRPVVLAWREVRPLAADEYYQVDVDFNYGETNSVVRYAARRAELTLPAGLYQTPNCGVFNWQVTLERHTGTDETGQPTGEAISYPSLYWYVAWTYPAGQAPFNTSCPNAQF